jgi:hypothetical protein
MLTEETAIAEAKSFIQAEVEDSQEDVGSRGKARCQSFSIKDAELIEFDAEREVFVVDVWADIVWALPDEDETETDAIFRIDLPNDYDEVQYDSIEYERLQ